MTYKGYPVSVFVELNFVFGEYSVPIKQVLYKHAATARPHII